LKFLLIYMYIDVLVQEKSDVELYIVLFSLIY